MPHILITNDDGIHAPGLRALVDALKDDAQLTVVAPSRERSAAAAGNGAAERSAAFAQPLASRREAPTQRQRKFLLDLHEELLAVLTLLERE